ncbi:protein kinase domain-containing protein [Georgenia sp. Z1344]|uniref:protein kinase domain-containing protein n=1 Tax=Georgenia sp. Z1344 TaxID=3416706 RepID=UPI003CED0F39
MRRGDGRPRGSCRETWVGCPGTASPVRWGGGSGRVFSATSDERGSPVIVSVVDLPDGRAGDALRRRLTGLRTRPHPHLPRVVDVVVMPEGRAALVTEVVPGASLASVRVARGSLSVPEVAGVLTDIGSALAHLAAEGIVHGDVSPANVVVDTAGAVVLVDLVGDVRLEEGTPGHVAPERLAGGPASTAADVYALGMLVRGLAPGDAEVEALTAQACDDDPDRRPTARALAARAAELGGRSGVRLPAGADLAGALLREGALREATAHALTGRTRARGRRARRPDGPAGERRGAARGPGRSAGSSRDRVAVAGRRGDTGGVDRRGVRSVVARVGVLAAAAVVLAVGGYVTTEALLAPDGNGGAVVEADAVAEASAVGESDASGESQSVAGADVAPAAPLAGAGPTEPAPDAAESDDSSQGITDATGVVTAVVETREAALLAGDPAALAGATVEASPARAADADLSGALATTTIDDLSTSVTSVEVLEGSVADGRFVARVNLHQEEWRARDGTGESVYPATEACGVLELERVGDGWAVADSAACESAADQGG